MKVFSNFGLLLLICIPVLLQAASLQPFYSESRCTQYTGASSKELLRAKDLFKRALRQDRLDAQDYRQQWALLGFEWRVVDLQGARGWLAVEQRTKSCRGQGIYLFNASAQTKTLLQVPHRYKDRYSGLIARQWVAEDGPRAVAWSTTARTVLDSDGRQADVAHRWDSFFMALTMAYVDVFPRGRVVQLHGFSSAKRRTKAGRESNIIVSAGHAWPGKHARDVQACLDSVLEGGVNMYPQQVRELGAVSNVQGQLMRSLGHNGFVHVELSDSLRTQLKGDLPLSVNIGRCLIQEIQR